MGRDSEPRSREAGVGSVGTQQAPHEAVNQRPPGASGETGKRLERLLAPV